MADQPDERFRLLFIARAFPPTVGGMENFAYQLSESMAREANVTTLANRRGKKALPAFLPSVLAFGTYLARKHRVEAIHLADGLLAPFGLALKKVTGLPVTCTVHGLDITYPNRLYQSVVPRALAQLDLTVADSEATATEVRTRIGDKIATTVIPLGVNPLPNPDAAALRHFRQSARISPGQRVILTVGRLVQRKGVAWFAGHVLPGLPQATTYVAIGEGKESGAIRAAAAMAGVADRIRLLGRVSDDLLAAAYRSADILVMPNVPIAGDIEGFGLVALEAAASGLPVVASRLEGITQAVQHKRNGFLVAPLSVDEYLSTLTCLLALAPEDLRVLGASCAEFTLSTYGWNETARAYLDAIGEVAAPREARAEPRD